VARWLGSAPRARGSVGSACTGVCGTKGRTGKATQGPQRAAWTLLGFGVALLAAGAVATVVQQNEVGIYNDDARCL
jgi:hypothetical protein